MAGKSYEELTFTDDFMFCKVLENDPTLCKELIETILGVGIEIVDKVGRQKSIEIMPDGKGIRLDVHLEGDGRIFNLEMQNAKKDDLPRRTRYYQGMIDLDQLEKGVKYKELKDSYIIFICRFDPFGKGYRSYTLKTVVDENTEIEYNDGTHKLFLSSLPGLKGTMSEELRQFLSYVNGNAPEGDLTKRLDAAVEQAKSMASWRKEYMFLYEIKDEARAEGRIETIIEFVKDGKISIEEAASKANMTPEEFKEMLETSTE